MHAARCEPYYHVAAGNIAARQDFSSPDGADGKSREIIVALSIEAGHFCGLAAEQCTASVAASRRDSLHDCCALRRIEFAAREIIKKEQWLGALHHEVIDRHRNEIDPDRIVARGFDGNLELGAYPIGSRDQNRVVKTRCFWIEKPAKAADSGVRTGARRCPHKRLDQFHHAVASIDVDT